MRRFVVLVLALAALVQPARATTRIAPPDVTALSTAWFGWSEDGFVLFRLVLHPDETGLFAYKQAAKVVLCRIRHWSLSGTKLTGELLPIDDAGEAMTIHGRAWNHKLALVLTAKAISGTRRVPFTAYKESTTQEFVRELTERMTQQ